VIVRVNVVVEGSTERVFVTNVLAPMLGAQRVFLSARMVENSRSRGTVYRGGMRQYAPVRRDLLAWLKQDTTAIVTTMFDLYALPDDFPGVRTAAAQSDPFAKVAEIERALGADVLSGLSESGAPPDRFVPYVQLHEFEALLFTQPQQIVGYFDDIDGGRQATDRLEAVRNGFPTPEHIDDGADTAPSKRIIRVLPKYARLKSQAGPAIADRIGLPALRSACKHFGEWLSRLESLSS
jgi:hypothetical protein